MTQNNQHTSDTGIVPSNTTEEPLVADSSSEDRVIFEQLRGIVGQGQVYYTVRTADGEQSTFTDEEEAVKYAARVGGVVVARPTRAALRMVAAAGRVTAVPIETNVAVEQNIVHIQTPYLSIVMIPNQGETTVVAVGAVEVGGRVMPAVGAASTDGFRGKQAERPIGERTAHAVLLATTRALSRGIADGTGLVNVGETVVRRTRSPQEQIIQRARELGLLGKVHQIIGTRLDQITPEMLPAALEALDKAVSESKGGKGGEQ